MTNEARPRREVWKEATRRCVVGIAWPIGQLGEAGGARCAGLVWVLVVWGYLPTAWVGYMMQGCKGLYI